MKIRIITIHDIGNNFGSAIQSCALCEYLNAQGYDAEIIHYTPNYRNWKQELRYRLVNLLFLRDYRARRRCFDRYYRAHARLTERVETIGQIPAFERDTVYLVGSDQVWNPHFPCGSDGAYTLDFTDSPWKMAYAASVGCAFTAAEAETLARRIRGFQALSFREEATRAQMASYFPEAAAVLDPVFLKPKQAYLKEFGPRMQREPYLLIYSINPDPLFDEAVAAYRKEHGVKTVLVGGFQKKCGCDLFLRGIGPAEFLNLLYHAEHVLTSSFHGLALSLLLEKDVSVIEPRLSRLRIRDLLERFDLTDRILTPETLETTLCGHMDYSRISPRIEEARSASCAFLLHALGRMKDELEEEPLP